MAGWYHTALRQIFDRTLDITGGLKVLLVHNGYSYIPDHSPLDSHGGGSISDNELAVTGYTGGHGGAGRKDTTATVVEDAANDRVVITFADVSWAVLGGVSNDRVRGAVVFKEVSSDSTSLPIAYIDFSNVTDPMTTGSSVVVTLDPDASLELNVVSRFYTRALKEIVDRTLDATAGLKLMLADDNYTFDSAHQTISQLSEITATNYAGGFGGAGRKAVTATFVEQDTGNRMVAVIPSTTWTSLGGAVNDIVRAAVLVKEATSDADSRVIAYLDFTNVTDPSTDGTDFVLTCDPTNGNVYVNVV